MEENTPQQDNTSQDTPEQPKHTQKPKKKGLSFTWVLLIAFALMMLNAIRPHPKPSMNWIDYETGIKTAAQQNKPIMLAFYKKQQQFSDQMWANTYSDKNMIKFIETNFVPISIDVDENPDLAKQYDVSYYPFHVFKTPDNKQILKTRRGYDTPGQFKPVLQEVLDKIKNEPAE